MLDSVVSREAERQRSRAVFRSRKNSGEAYQNAATTKRAVFPASIRQKQRNFACKTSELYWR